MLTHSQILQRFLHRKLNAVIRSSASDINAHLAVADAIIAGGIDIIEVTMTTPSALKTIERLALRRDCIVGAGTVLTTDLAHAVLNAGASFVVSPVFDPTITAIVRSAERVMIPGAYTPTEIYSAWMGGADIIKVFPMPTEGAAYLKLLRGPLPNIPMAPSGGVNDATASALLKAGAVALNVGSWLTYDDDGAASTADAITEKAGRMRAAVNAMLTK